MKKIDRKDIFFILYMTAVIVLAVVYFSVPERAVFIEFQADWWREMGTVVRSLF